MRDRTLVPLLVLAGFGVLLACGEDAPTRAGISASATPAAQRQQSSGAGSNTQSGVQSSTCDSRPTVAGSGVFGRQGGTLVVGSSRLIIPRNALTDTVTVSATIPGDTATRIELRPSGLRFAVTAVLRLDTSSCSVTEQSGSHVEVLDETGQRVGSLSAQYDPAQHTIAVGIMRFAGYAIAF